LRVDCYWSGPAFSGFLFSKISRACCLEEVAGEFRGLLEPFRTNLRIRNGIRNGIREGLNQFSWFNRFERRLTSRFSLTGKTAVCFL
tara:strand:- start:7359 stop:7619 length:261 start_codon:yes stop_codon:yes gene_type:complete